MASARGVPRSTSLPGVPLIVAAVAAPAAKTAAAVATAARRKGRRDVRTPLASRFMTGLRRLSQAISEGDGISVIVHVDDPAAATTAETQGAEALAVSARVDGLDEATGLPVLWRAGGDPADARDAGADAWVLVVEREAGRDIERLHGESRQLGLECVVEVRDEEELATALERVDPEIFLLAAARSDEEDSALDRVLALLPDVPAGKLAIAEVAHAEREEIVALERAGMDGVIVGARSIAGLVGDAPPDV